MRKTLAALLLLSTAASALAPAVRAAAPGGRACPGMAVARFEQEVPAEVKRYAFDGPMLEPFLQLWKSGQRPALPALPETVTVYALPEHPYLLGYQRQGCVIAFLAVERQQFWRWLRPSLGWPA